MKLTYIQKRCLAFFSSIPDPKGGASAIDFAAGTLSSLRKAGMLERFKVGRTLSSLRKAGMLERFKVGRTLYRITEAGMLALGAAS